jgi:hypothetical protein
MDEYNHRGFVSPRFRTNRHDLSLDQSFLTPPRKEGSPQPRTKLGFFLLENDLTLFRTNATQASGPSFILKIFEMSRQQGFFSRKSNGMQGHSYSSGEHRAPESGYSNAGQSTRYGSDPYEQTTHTAHASRRPPPEPFFLRNHSNVRRNPPLMVQQNIFIVNQYQEGASSSGIVRREQTVAERIGMPPHLCDENGVWTRRDTSPRREQQPSPNPSIHQQERRMSSCDFDSTANQNSGPIPVIREVRPDWVGQDARRGARGGPYHDDNSPEVWEPDSDHGESHHSDGPIITHLSPSRAGSRAPSSTGHSDVSRGRQPRQTHKGH